MTKPRVATPFNETRFRIPVLSTRFVRRARVTELLGRSIAHQVTLVTGPAGTGKTLAVADWTYEGTPPGPVAWLSLDKGDAEGARLWASMIAALAVAVPEVLPALEVPDWPDPDFFAAAAARAGGDLVLVLDDVQALDGGSALEALELLLRRPPDGLRIVMIARHDPPIALQRLRLEHQIGEVRFADLAFTEQEASLLLTKSGVNISDADLARLMSSTGGWAAALRLAALALQAPSSGGIDPFGGVNFLVSEYLWDEVLRLLSPRYANFLLRTSIMDRVSAELAQALTGETDAHEVLQTLAREQLLAHEVQDVGWFRTHSLLTEVLHARLRVSNPGLKRELHYRAALWFEEHGAWLEALDQAISSGDWDLTGQMAMRSAPAILFGAERHRYVDLVARVSGGAASDQPEVLVARAIAAYCRHDEASMSVLAARAEPAIAQLPEPRRSTALLALRSLICAQAHRRGDALGMRASGVEAHALHSRLSAAEAPGWGDHRGLTLAARGAAELWSGQPGVAVELLTAAVKAYPSPPSSQYGQVYFEGLLAVAQAAKGRLAAAQATADAALTLARSQGRSRAYEAQWAWLALSTVRLYAGDFAGAREARADCRSAAGEWLNPFVGATLQALSARQALSSGDLVGARRRLALAQEGLAKRPGMVLLETLLTSVQVDLELAGNNVEGATRALRRYDAGGWHPGGKPASPDPLANSRARLALATGRPERVHGQVAHLLGGEGAGALQAWLSVAAAETRMRHDTLAMEAVGKALDLACAEGAEVFIRRMARYLTTALHHHSDVVGTHRELVDDLLGRGGHVGESRQITPLTEREQAVLAYLPTMGSNAEIAAALGISENTVKQHLKSVYRKLSAASRREAVRVARANGLLGFGAKGAPHDATVGEPRLGGSPTMGDAGTAVPAGDQAR